MKRTTILLDESLLLDIQQLAEEENTTASRVIREALAEYVAVRRKPRPRLSFQAIGDSGQGDVSERAEEILAEDARPPEGWD